MEGWPGRPRERNQTRTVRCVRCWSGSPPGQGLRVRRVVLATELHGSHCLRDNEHVLNQVRRLRIEKPHEFANLQSDSRRWHRRLHPLQTRPLRGGRPRGLPAAGLEVRRGHDGIRITRGLSQEDLQAQSTVAHVARVFGQRCERLVGHRFNRFVHRQQTGGMTRLLLGRPVRSDPFGNGLLPFFVDA